MDLLTSATISLAERVGSGIQTAYKSSFWLHIASCNQSRDVSISSPEFYKSCHC